MARAPRGAHTRGVADLVPFPRSGVVRDSRGQGRALRVTWHHEEGVVVLSTWRGPTCVGTVRVAPEDVPFLVDVLVSGLGQGYSAAAPPPDEVSTEAGTA